MTITIVSTGNEEVDRQIGGGLPTPSLALIEGGHGTGKSSLTALFMKGLLLSGRKVLFITTESNIREYIEKMKIITYDFRREFIQNRLIILPINIDGMTWSPRLTKNLLPVLGRYMAANSNKVDAIIIDSLSALTAQADTNAALEFFTRCKSFVSKGKTIILTMHPSAVSEDVALRIRSTCDAYLKVSSATIAGRGVKIMEVVKLIGASSQVASMFSFDIDPSFGIRIVPVSMANA